MLLALLAFLPWSASAGMTPEEVKAFEGYKAKAEKGDAEAQYNLGLCYFYGTGVAKDEVEAVKWYRKAAEQGDAKGQCNLAACYARGTGVAKYPVEAYAYWNLAGITVEVARNNLAILEKEMSPDQIAAGKKRTKELQKEIDARIAAKKAEYANKAGK